MKYLLRTLTSLVAVVALVACVDASGVGSDLNRDFAKAWGDTVAMKAFAEHYDALIDSITFPYDASRVADEFLDRVEAGGNDTMLVAANLIALDADHFANTYSHKLVDDLLSGKLTSQQAADLDVQINGLAMILGRNDAQAAYQERVDALAASLSVKDQMRLYAAAASPTVLGMHMRLDRQNGADPATLQERVDALRTIYNDEQFKEFLASYNSDANPQ